MYKEHQKNKKPFTVWLQSYLARLNDRKHYKKHLPEVIRGLQSCATDLSFKCDRMTGIANGAMRLSVVALIISIMALISKIM